ncbi:hypothetical protein L369_04879 [Enterobacter sp. MGH 23]|nr:VirB10/TraB/TrbI family type IV secretion system protein [Enterobacter sp. MGH 23]ESN19064.1 hypothetical protein L369_04879 [Enterobacter sp. MGH 23]
MLTTAALFQLAMQCAPAVHPDTIHDITRTESGLNPYAIAEIVPVKGGRSRVISHLPSSKDEALKIVEAIKQKKHRYSVGLMQITSTNFPQFGVSAESMFNPCDNMTVAAKIITDCYQRGGTLQRALSCYYSGNFETGQRPESAFGNTSYVQRIGYVVPSTPAGQSQDNGLARITGVKRLGLDPDLYIPADRHIPCAMMQRFVSDVGGRFNCLISEDIYSASNAVRLIPAGTEARGLYRTGTLKNGQGRLFLAITELRTPEPGRLVIPMVDSQAVGALGENGVAGWIDNHWLERIGNTLLLGTVQDFAAAASGSSPGKDRNTDYTENTRAATAEMAKTLLENSINIPPTMYLNQGDVIGLVTGADIDFSDVYRLRMR